MTRWCEKLWFCSRQLASLLQSAWKIWISTQSSATAWLITDTFILFTASRFHILTIHLRGSDLLLCSLRCGNNARSMNHLLVGRSRSDRKQLSTLTAGTSPGWLLWVQELCVRVCVMMVVRHPERWAEHWGAAPSAQHSNSEDPSCRTATVELLVYRQVWSTVELQANAAHITAPPPTHYLKTHGHCNGSCWVRAALSK